MATRQLRNAQVIKAIVSKNAPRLFKKDFFEIVQPRFEKIKDDMLKEFLDHPVTREILAGPESDNISGTLGGVTNLFAFIGFDKDDPFKPIQDILSVFLKINIRDIGPAERGRTYRINFPSSEDIWAVTPVPWASGERSWAQGIEQGLSGLGYFAFAEVELNNSRSGVGFQRRKLVRKGVRFKNTKYISELLNKYQREFRRGLGGRIII